MDDTERQKEESGVVKGPAPEMTAVGKIDLYRQMAPADRMLAQIGWLRDDVHHVVSSYVLMRRRMGLAKGEPATRPMMMALAAQIGILVDRYGASMVEDHLRKARKGQNARLWDLYLAHQKYIQGAAELEAEFKEEVFI